MSHSAECMVVCMNRTIVTTQRKHHMIWIGWQQGCKHVSWTLLLSILHYKFHFVFYFILFSSHCKTVLILSTGNGTLDLPCPENQVWGSLCSSLRIWLPLSLLNQYHWGRTLDNHQSCQLKQLELSHQSKQYNKTSANFSSACVTTNTKECFLLCKCVSKMDRLKRFLSF